MTFNFQPIPVSQVRDARVRSALEAVSANLERMSALLKGLVETDPGKGISRVSSIAPKAVSLDPRVSSTYGSPGDLVRKGDNVYSRLGDFAGEDRQWRSLSARRLTLPFHYDLTGFTGSTFTFRPLAGYYTPVVGRVVAASVRMTLALTSGGLFRFMLFNGTFPTYEFASVNFAAIGVIELRRTYTFADAYRVAGELTMSTIMPPGWSGTVSAASGCVVLEEE